MLDITFMGKANTQNIICIRNNTAEVVPLYRYGCDCSNVTVHTCVCVGEGESVQCASHRFAMAW
jgi:hypothetical protein